MLKYSNLVCKLHLDVISNFLNLTPKPKGVVSPRDGICFYYLFLRVGGFMAVVVMLESSYTFDCQF